MNKYCIIRNLYLLVYPIGIDIYIYILHLSYLQYTYIQREMQYEIPCAGMAPVHASKAKRKGLRMDHLFNGKDLNSLMRPYHNRLSIADRDYQ